MSSLDKKNIILKNISLPFKASQFIFVLLTFSSISIFAESALWADYRQSNPRGQGSILANYSYAGYHYCEKELPAVNESNYTYFDVLDYGAIPNDSLSDRQAVVDAIAAAENHSGKAVVYFPAGRFNLNGVDDFGKYPIVITGDSIVLKGAGQDVTELYFDQPSFINKEPLIRFSPTYPNESYWRGDDVLGNVNSYPEKGGFQLKVTNSHKYKPGMVVNIDADLFARTERGKGYFTQHTVPDGLDDKEDYLFELHQVDRVEGDVVFFKEPIHLDLPHMENAKIRDLKQSIEECGIEDMTISGNYREQFKHHNGSRFGERYDMLQYKDTRNCWMRNVRIKDYSVALELHRAIACSFFNINLVGHTGHNAMGGQYSYGNLFMYIRENTQTHHGLGGDHSFVNTVFSRCNQFDGPEAHCSWPRATLYDLNMGGFVPRPGGAKFFPHHGKDLCFWNWNVTRIGTKDFWPDGKNYGYFMPPVIAGLHGEPFTIPDQETDLLACESMGTKITEIESLFEAQLADRLGTLPQWMDSLSKNFETNIRYAGITITSPSAHSVFSDGNNITLKLDAPERFPTSEVKKVEIQISTEGLYSGFQNITNIEGWKDQINFSSDKKGTIVVKALMYHSKTELEESRPITIFIGDPKQMKPISIEKAAMLTHNQRVSLYADFLKVGGAEASSFPENTAFTQYNNGSLFYTVEKEFYRQQLVTYEKFGREKIKPILGSSSNVTEANKLIDKNTTSTANNTYGSLACVFEFDLGEEYDVEKIELEWINPITKDVKLEVQTSSDPKAWYSLVNDEPLWEFGVQQIGQTLTREPVPENKIWIIYMPKRTCRYIRLSAQNIPNNKLAEVRFYESDKSTLSAQQMNDDAEKIRIYPNPTTGKVYVDADLNTINKLTLYNQKGQRLLNETSVNEYLDITNFAPGLYTLLFQRNNNKNSLFRIVKN